MPTMVLMDMSITTKIIILMVRVRGQECPRHTNMSIRIVD